MQIVREKLARYQYQNDYSDPRADTWQIAKSPAKPLHGKISDRCGLRSLKEHQEEYLHRRRSASVSPAVVVAADRSGGITIPR